MWAIRLDDLTMLLHHYSFVVRINSLVSLIPLILKIFFSMQCDHVKLLIPRSHPDCVHSTMAEVVLTPWQLSREDKARAPFVRVVPLSEHEG